MAAEQDEVRELLSKMSSASRNLSYEGLFTFEVGGSLDTYKIDHRVIDGKETEILQRLNGSKREISKGGLVSDCLSPGKKLLQELAAGVGSTPDLLQHYKFEIHRDQRIAERSATVINLIPARLDRYGYSIGVDDESKLPLKIVLLEPNKRYLERIQFIELAVGTETIGTETINSNEVSEIDSSIGDEITVSTEDCIRRTNPELQGWYVAWLPQGFVFAGQKTAATGDEMLSFTDGLTSFSVFIGDGQKKPPVREARAHLGATTLYMVRRVWRQQPFSVTVVGEVPLATAQKVAIGLNPQ